MAYFKTTTLTSGGGGGGIDPSDSTLMNGSSLLSGVSAYGPAGVKINGTMPSQTSSDVTLYASTVTYEPGYYGSSWTVAAPGIDTSDGTVNANSQILSDYTAYAQGVKYTGSMPSHTAQTEIISTPKTYQSGYYTSSWTVTPDSGGTDTSDATVSSNSQILSSFTAYSKGTKYIGSMPSITPSSETITTSRTYQSGYYAEPWTVTAGGTDTSDGTLNSNNQLLSGVIAYSKGVKYTGNIQTRSASNSTITSAKSYSAGYYANSWTVTPSMNTSGTATASQILKDKTAWVNGSQISGTMSNVGAIDYWISPGGITTIPQGYHNGNGIVRAYTAEYIGDAVPSQVVYGKKFYSNSGILQTGTMTDLGDYDVSLDPGQFSASSGGYCSSITFTANPIQEQYTLLWYNPTSITSTTTFAAQTVTLASNMLLDGFTFIKIIYCPYAKSATLYTRQNTVYYKPTEINTYMCLDGGSNMRFRTAQVTSSGLALNFKQGKQGDDGTTNNAIGIPISVIGITYNGTYYS